MEIVGFEKRIPDSILYINGLPLVVFEFKSAMREDCTIHDAYIQLTVRYKRDIPELLKYNAFCIISDGANNKMGSFFAPYEFFYAWRKVIGDEKLEKDGIDSLFTMVQGMFDKNRLRDIIRNFIYFPDTSKKNEKIVCRYPQYYAANKLHIGIVSRIQLNEQMNQKLEETAQAIYKHWFVDFEFPISAEYALSIGKPELKGKPYKSNGGEMMFCEKLSQEIPKKWKAATLGEIIDLHDSRRIPLSSFERKNMRKTYPYYGAASLMDHVENYIFDGDYILLGEDGSVVTEKGTPVLQYVWGKFWVNNHAHILSAKNGFSLNTLYQLLSRTNVVNAITGGVQAKISQSNLKKINIIKPAPDILNKYNEVIDPIFQRKKNVIESMNATKKADEILLSGLATYELMDAA